MALGAKLFDGLLGSNGVVTIETPTVVVTGGTVTTWATLTESVDVLITQLGGNRSPSAGTDFQTDTHTVTGISEDLARTDTRFKVTSCPDLPDLEDTYLRVNETVRHPKGRGGLVAMRITAKCTRIQAPANQL
jgi:hypothetical protein